MYASLREAVKRTDGLRRECHLRDWKLHLNHYAQPCADFLDICIVSLILSTRIPYSGPSRNWWKKRPGLGLYRISANSGTYRKKLLPANTRMEQGILVEIFAADAREYPENARVILRFHRT